MLKRVAQLDTLPAGEAHGRLERLWNVRGQLSFAVDASRQQAHGSKPTYHDLRLLQLHLRVISVILKTIMFQNEMVFDGCREDFDYMLSEAEELLAHELQPGSLRGPTSVGSTLGLIPPLFVVATKCRIPTIRHRALELLQGSKRRERGWNSCVAPVLARVVIEAEEKTTILISCPSRDHPLAERWIRLNRIEFNREGGRMTIHYVRMPQKAPGVKETVIMLWIANIDDNHETGKLSQKSLLAYGYAGTILISPRISCQCFADGKA